MDGVGKVERRRVAAQAHDLALWREDKDLVLKEVNAQVVQELVRIVDVILDGPVEAPADPVDRRVDRTVLGRHLALGVAGLLVEPVRGDAVLGRLVHLDRADLDLDGLAVGADHRGVERLVEVGLGRGDVVLEAAGHGVPQRVDGAERRVAVPHRLRDDAQGDEVVDVREVPALAGHLLVDGPEVLGAAGDLVVLEADALELVVQGLDGGLGVVLALGARVLDHAGNALVLLGLEPEEGQVLKLPLDGRDAQAVGERGVDVHGLARLEEAAVGRQRRQGAHVVQAVRQLDDDHADVLRHGEEHLAQVEGLLLVHRGHLDGRELGDAVHQLGHGLAKEVRYLRERGGGILHRVVEKRRADGVLVHVEVLAEDEGHLDGVVDVGLARATALVAVVVGREVVGTVDLCPLLVVEIGARGLLEDAEVRGVRDGGLLGRRGSRGS